MQSFGLGQLTDMPQQERCQRVDEQQRMQALRSKRERLNSNPMPELSDLVSRKFSSICMRCAYSATISSARYERSCRECASSHGSCALARASARALAATALVSRSEEH